MKTKLALCSLLVASLTSASAASSPNVVLIFADDMGYGDVTSYDAKSKIHTPNLDRLARGGMRFTDAHSASAVCTPSRYALLTGRYSWRTGLKSGVLGGFSQPLIEKGRMTLAHLFQDKGYRTACIGKWHLGMDWTGGMRGEKGYNMRTDPDETTNLIEKRPEVVSELTALAGEYVRKGRSTPGRRQKTVLQSRPQLDWLSLHPVPTTSEDASDTNRATRRRKRSGL